jgi:hypothetical protein
VINVDMTIAKMKAIMQKEMPIPHTTYIEFVALYIDGVAMLPIESKINGTQIATPISLS